MLGIIGNKFSIGKETYHPFSAELHYFRIEKRYWSICFERIKKAGYSIISTAVPWNIHQDDDKHFDFLGVTDPKKDLIVFLELAREFGFKVILRPGPWVSGQLKNGGLPDFLYKDLKLFARDVTGQELKLKDDCDVDGGYLPSYLHSNFKFHLKSYFKEFIEITKNYVHPRGPVFMVELDFETSFGGLVNPESADYNPDILAMYYPDFLEERYSEIKNLNSSYKEKNKEFDQVEPPRNFRKLDITDYPKVMDWFRFREYILNKYLEFIEDIFTSYTVEPLIYRSLYFKPGDLIPAYNLVPQDRFPFLGSNVFAKGSYFDLVIKAKFLRAEYGFAYAASYTSGTSASDSVQGAKITPVTKNTARFYLAAGLSSGFKGMNQYMFVDRDHWHGSPLHKDGTVSDNYAVAKRFNHMISSVGIDEMESKPEIAVVGNRLYNWMHLVEGKKDFAYIDKILGESTVGFCRDLMRLKINFGIRENQNWDTLKTYKLVFIPSTEVMSETDQEAIVELVKSGVSVIMCGVMPKYDENFKTCQVLANHFRIKSSVDYHISAATFKEGEFPTYVYSSLKTTDDSKVKKIVKSDSKLIGVCSNRFKGNFYFFSFDIASGGNHRKLSFIESILSGENIESYLYCSDPSVDISFQMGEKKGILYVVAPPPGELSDSMEASRKQVIIKADLKDAGFKAANIKLTNIFEDEEEVKPIKITAKELKNGIALDLNFPDGIIFLVERK